MSAVRNYDNVADFAICCPHVDTAFVCFNAGTAKKLRSQIATQVFHIPFILKVKAEDGSWIPVGNPMEEINSAHTINTKLVTLQFAEKLLQHALIKRDRLDNIILAQSIQDGLDGSQAMTTRPTAIIYAFPTKKS
ncbi:MAG: hypothetical protein COA43_00620 [Robiginitomaculum sp.]|nr:MAG: hypothetical protein COA43_00620 [Robiginitomaculum sp.]